MTVQNPIALRAIATPTRWVPAGALSLATLRQLRPVILPIATAGAMLALWQAACTLLRISRM